MKFKKLHLFLISFSLLFFWSCSKDNTSFFGKKYHETVTKFNVLYNGKVAYERGVKQIQKDFADDYDKILSVEPTQKDETALLVTGETKENPHFKRAEKKAIKAVQLHSLETAGKEMNTQIDEAYMLLGQARYHDLRFVPALESFNYIINHQSESNFYKHALVWKEKTNIKLKYNDLALGNLKRIIKKEDLKGENLSEAWATVAQGYINLKYLDSAQMPLKIAIEQTKSKDKKARYTFLLGQLKAQTNQKTEAIENYSQVIAWDSFDRKELTINAYTERFKNQDFSKIDTAKVSKQFFDLLRNRENRKFRDVIFHQLGVMNDWSNNTSFAVKYYNNSLKLGKKNESLKMKNYFKLADLYYRNKNFEKSGMYYDSTLTYINPLSKEYVFVKRKRNNLKGIVKYERILKNNDSILTVYHASPQDQKVMIEKIIEKKKKEEEELKKKDKGKDEGLKGSPMAIVKKSSFYFYSKNAREKGSKNFKKKFGDIQLIDNWKWDTQEKENIEDEENKIEEIEVDPEFTVEFYLEQLPQGKEEVVRLQEDRNDAYYQLGLLYSSKIAAYNTAIDRLETLLALKPHDKLEQEALYQLYKVYALIKNKQKSDEVKQIIVSKYPESNYAKIMLDPNARLSTNGSLIVAYEDLYRQYSRGEYKRTLDQLDEVIPTIFGSKIKGKYELLRAVIKGKLYGLDEYQKSMRSVIQLYPDSEEAKEAQRIISEEIALVKKKRIRLDLHNNLKMVYDVSYPLSKKDESFKNKLEVFAKDRSHTGVSFSMDVYNEEKVFFVIHGIKSGNLAKSAQIYLDIEKEYGIKRTPVLLSSDDYVVVLTKKKWEEYKNKIKRKNERR